MKYSSIFEQSPKIETILVRLYLLVHTLQRAVGTQGGIWRKFDLIDMTANNYVLKQALAVYLSKLLGNKTLAERLQQLPLHL